MKITPREKDILIAGAIGDAVGYVVEFSKLSKIHKEYGKDGLTLDLIHPEAPLTVSDDTQMTLFALEALHIIHLTQDQTQYYKSFKQWYLTQFNPKKEELTSPLGKFLSLHNQRAPGTTCLGSLGKKEPLPEPINDSKGCGGIMRAAPFGFLNFFDVAFEQGLIQAKVTHGNPTGYLPAGFFAGLINLLVKHDIRLERAIELCDQKLLNYQGHEDTSNIVFQTMEIFANTKGNVYGDIKFLGEGWVAEEALAISMYCALVARSFEEVIQFSINHDGDSDSTGSMAAQLWVAGHGLPEKYRNWYPRLDVYDAFEFITNEDNYVQYNEP